MLDLSVGGVSWEGWFFGRYGRAREWRIHAPDETTYTAAEIANLRALTLDVNYLTVRIHELSDFASPDAMHFGPEDARTLLEAMEAVQRAARQIALTSLRRRVTLKAE